MSDIGKKLKIGIIGCGFVTNFKHLPILSKLAEQVELVAFCDIIEERAIKAAKEYGAERSKIYADYKELLKDESIDVVYVCTPNVSHSFITVDALEAGMHVMCEKPMAIDSTEAKKMLDAAKLTGKKLTIGYQNRFRKDSQLMHEICRSGDLGEIYYGKAFATRRRAVPTWGVFMDKEKQGGGALIDIGTHALDLTLWMMDNYKPKVVMGSISHKLKYKNEGNSFGLWKPEEFNVEDSARGFIRMENGATIILEAAWALNLTEAREACCSVCGTDGGVEMLGLSANESNLIVNGQKYGKLFDMRLREMEGAAFFAVKNQTDAEVEAAQWINAVVNDKEPVVKPEQAYAVTQILEAVYKSAKTGQAVYFND